jgi:hypothetical protein
MVRFSALADYGDESSNAVGGAEDERVFHNV